MSGGRLTWLVFEREVREGVRGKTFLVSTAVMLLILGAIVGLPAALGNPAKKVKLGVVGAPPPALVQALDAAAKPFGAKVKLHVYADVAAARDGVSHRRVEAALVPARRLLLLRTDPTGSALTVATVATRSLELPLRADRLGLTRAQAEGLLAPALAVQELEPEGGAGAEVFAYVGSIVLLLALSIYGQAVLTGVVQEKSSRVVEVLLAALRPRHLLAGKVLGIGALGLVQIAAIAAGAVVAGAAGLVDVPSIGRTAPLMLLWFLLGFAFYAVAFAALGALVSRIEDTTSAATPVTMTMAGSYLLSFAVLTSNIDGPGAVVLSLLPPSAPFALVARVAVTDVPLWQHAAALGLMLAAIWGLVRLGGRIYELGLLRTGARIPFREALAVALQRS